MVKKRGKGRAVKKARQKFGRHYEDEDVKLAPHSMVIHRGEVEKNIKELVTDFRKVMEPFTARELNVTRKNNLKDFVSIAGPLHVSHLIMFSQTEQCDYLKIARLPRGPTIHFKILEYSLCNDVLSVLKKKHTHQKQFLHQPLLILNGFNVKSETEESDKANFHLKLLTTSLQNMFPSINITKVQLNDIRRCVLFQYNKDDQTIDFRQYYIRLMPVGLSKPVKKLVQEKLPNLSNFQDISEFIEKGGMLSESEAELDGPENEVEVKQDVKSVGNINLKSSTSAIRLSEIGPRLKLKLFKIQEGICDGDILYHDSIKKSPEEIAAIRESLKQKKKAEKQNKAKTLPVNGKKDKKQNGNKKKRSRKEEEDNVSDDDDAEYYRQELGQEPDQALTRNNDKTKRQPFKKFKKSTDSEANENEKKDNNFVKFGRQGQKKIIKTKFLRYSAKKKQMLN